VQLWLSNHEIEKEKKGFTLKFEEAAHVMQTHLCNAKKQLL